MNRSTLYTKDFQYPLPDDKIAKFPLADRNQSKLLVYQQNEIKESRFSELEDYLPDNAMLVFNDTKVIAARLIFTKKTGSTIEVFCLEPHDSTVEQALNTTNTCIWKCMVGNLKKFKKDTILELAIADTILKATLHEKREEDVLVRFEWEKGVSFSSILDAAGEVPLPPYLNRASEEEDSENYQTVYAKNQGAVAAPTAGLHFVKEQLTTLQQKGHSLEYLTLYVGAGTFKTVKSEKLVEHVMHKERIVISKETIQRWASHDHPIISVGTTSLRSMESLYWLGVKMFTQQTDQMIAIEQDDAYQLPAEWYFQESCQYILSILNKYNLKEVDFSSGLFIMPGYEMKSIDGLITNFHQPGSTLLSLIAAWVGDEWKNIYDYALDHHFRFLSFGDSSLLIK